MTRHLSVLPGRKKRSTIGEETARLLQARRRFAGYFAKVREQTGLSCAEIESILEIEPGMYAAWEQGFRLPRMEMVGEIFSRIHLSVDLEFEFQKMFTEIKEEARLLFVSNPSIA